MKKRILSSLLLVTLAAGSLAACQEGNNRGGSRLAGAVAGGLVGSQFGGGSGKLVGVGVGALLGGVIGDKIGQDLDSRDRNMAYNTSQKAFEATPTGRTVQWKNPDSGHYGQITPTKTVYHGGNVCREYQQKITVGGKTVEGYGTACRQKDGSWKIVD
jgi:surface antigen